MKRILFLFAFGLLLLFGWASVTAQESTLESDLTDLVAGYVDPTAPGIVLLVKQGDEPPVIVAAGMADVANGIPLNANDRFRIGSITKTFVSVVMLQLMEEGVLSLDDPLSRWLPAEIAQRIPESDTITLLNLLTMTSGIADYTQNDGFNDAVDKDPSHAWTAEETVSFLFDEPLNFAPGQGWEYSNSNYNLLQIVIETATNSPLAEQLEERIFAPLGMSQTYLEPTSPLGIGIVRGYEGNSQDVTEINDGVGLGDGGIISTAADLAIFPRALMMGQLLKRESLDLMFEGGVEAEGYGLGVEFERADWGMVIGHSGATAGFLADMRYVPNADLTIVAFSNNFDNEALSDAVADTFTLLFEQ